MQEQQPEQGKRLSHEEAKEVISEAVKIQDEQIQGVPEEILQKSAGEMGISPEVLAQARTRAQQEREKRANLRKAALFAVVVALTIFFGGLFSARGRLADAAMQVDLRKAQLDNVLQRRYDLIPQLVAVAKTSRQGSDDRLKNLQDLTAQWHKSEDSEAKLQVEQQLSGQIKDLMSRLQSDSKLAENETFHRLTDEIAGAENRIAVERKRYNEAAVVYNRTASGPLMGVYRLFLGYPAKHPLFEASSNAKRAPELNL